MPAPYQSLTAHRSLSLRECEEVADADLDTAFVVGGDWADGLPLGARDLAGIAAMTSTTRRAIANET